MSLGKFGSEDLSKIIKYVAYGITLSIIVALKNLKKKLISILEIQHVVFEWNIFCLI